MDQQSFIHNYIEETTPQFNKTLFTRDINKIIKGIEDIIFSIEREGNATIKVMKFEHISDYDKIWQTLHDYEEIQVARRRKSSNTKSLQENQYNYINLNESYIELLKVYYYIRGPHKNADGSKVMQHEIFPVLIDIPAVVNKFYHYINGNLYSSMFQVVDASTYNTSTSSNTKHYISLKTSFQNVRVFRNVNSITTTDGEPIYCVTYVNNTFNKYIPIIQFILAKYGLYGTLKFMGIYGNTISFSRIPGEKVYEDEYEFKAKRTEIYYHVPKALFNKFHVIQHIIYVLVTVPTKNTKFEDIFGERYWIYMLGDIFNSSMDPYEKGSSILFSADLIYDLPTKEDIHLPEEYKHDIFHILRWILWEYNNLRLKDNLNIRTKKIKSEEYIRNKYGAKLRSNMYRLSDMSKDVTIEEIKKCLDIPHDYIIKELSKKDPLIQFRSIVTDLDSFLPAKFTYKGDAGIQTISKSYKLIHPTNMGILDPDSSSPSDPGATGMIVPMVKLYENNYFSDFQEPLTFEDEYAKLYNDFKHDNGLAEAYNMQERLLNDKSISKEKILEAEKIAEMSRQMVRTTGIPEYNGLPLEGSGRVQYV